MKLRTHAPISYNLNQTEKSDVPDHVTSVFTQEPTKADLTFNSSNKSLGTNTVSCPLNPSHTCYPKDLRIMFRTSKDDPIPRQVIGCRTCRYDNIRPISSYLDKTRCWKCKKALDQTIRHKLVPSSPVNDGFIQGYIGAVFFHVQTKELLFRQAPENDTVSSPYIVCDECLSSIRCQTISCTNLVEIKTEAMKCLSCRDKKVSSLQCRCRNNCAYCWATTPSVAVACTAKSKQYHRIDQSLPLFSEKIRSIFPLVSDTPRQFQDAYDITQLLREEEKQGTPSSSLIQSWKTKSRGFLVTQDLPFKSVEEFGVEYSKWQDNVTVVFADSLTFVVPMIQKIHILLNHPQLDRDRKSWHDLDKMTLQEKQLQISDSLLFIDDGKQVQETYCINCIDFCTFCSRILTPHYPRRFYCLNKTCMKRFCTYCAPLFVRNVSCIFCSESVSCFQPPIVVLFFTKFPAPVFDRMVPGQLSDLFSIVYDSDHSKPLPYRGTPIWSIDYDDDEKYHRKRPAGRFVFYLRNGERIRNENGDSGDLADLPISTYSSTTFTTPISKKHKHKLVSLKKKKRRRPPSETS